MLQNLLTKGIHYKISSRTSQYFNLASGQLQSCKLCVRLYSSHKSVLPSYYGRTLLKHSSIKRTRHYTSQVDAHKKDGAVELKDKAEIATSKKINVKLKPTEVKRLFTLAEPEKWTLTGAIGLLIISSGVTMAVPFSLGKVLDIIYDTTSDLGAAREKLDSLCLMLCGVFLIGGLCNFGRVYLMSISGQRMTQALRKQVFAAILRQEPKWFSKNSTGELVNRLSADTQLVGRNLSQNVSDGLRSLLMVGAGTGMMFYMSPSLALIGLCVVPPVSLLAVFYGRFVRGITRQLQDTLAETSDHAEEKISNIKTVKVFNKEARECETYAKKIESLLNLAYKESLAVGSFYEQLTVGNLTSFLLYAAYVGISIGGLSSFYTELNKGIGAASRLWQIIDRKPTIPVSGGIRPKERPKGDIVLENISFSYCGAPMIKGLNLRLLPGKSVALVGRSGCGKSTIASLILRLYDPEQGRILLDGEDIRNLDPVWLRSHIGFVSQEPVLFTGSIKENIMYGLPNEEELLETEQAARAAQLQELANSSSAGWERQVGAGEPENPDTRRSYLSIRYVFRIFSRQSFKGNK
ncbi:unnamed protein product [Leptidea sinapis]|uniref:ABC transmembrane type-1 domain-containing protein n=1 Tax=Leptidea sinapis TaxID=189913 RepID=A0A5E4QCE8_9NEOP|nr:unnamed protein product [Leptidea sinapis]